jgi:hypothetical protein
MASDLSFLFGFLNNKIKINIKNDSKSKNILHYERYISGIGNKLIMPVPVTIYHSKIGSM